MFGIKGIARQLELLHEEMVRNREHTHRLFDEMAQFQREERLRANKVLEPLIASHNELIAEMRAQREGFLALIDEIRGGPGRAGGAPA